MNRSNFIKGEFTPCQRAAIRDSMPPTKVYDSGILHCFENGVSYGLVEEKDGYGLIAERTLPPNYISIPSGFKCVYVETRSGCGAYPPEWRAMFYARMHMGKIHNLQRIRAEKLREERGPWPFHHPNSQQHKDIVKLLGSCPYDLSYKCVIDAEFTYEECEEHFRGFLKDLKEGKYSNG